MKAGGEKGITPRPVKSTRRLAATLSMMTRRKGSSDILAARGTSRSAQLCPQSKRTAAQGLQVA